MAQSRAQFLARYKVIREIGRGCSSVVYEAVERASGVHVALKVVAKRDAPSVDREFAIHRKFESPYIVSIMDYADCENEFLCALEYANRGDLFSAIAYGGPFYEQDGAHVTKQMLLGLKVLHTHGIIHRDLKPENLLLHANEDGELTVKISDFGLAGMCDGGRLTESHCGTLGYCAPEILENRPYNEAADLWSLGVVVYVMLIGVLPFPAEDRHELCDQMVNGELCFEGVGLPPISTSAEEFIQGLVRVNADERMTVDQALGHPWLGDAPTPPLGDLREHLRSYHVRAKLRRVIMQADVALTLPLLSDCADA